MGGGSAMSQSVSTSTRIINGGAQTVTERTVTRPDGTVERTVETTGQEESPAAHGGIAQYHRHPRIEEDHGGGSRKRSRGGVVERDQRHHHGRSS